MPPASRTPNGLTVATASPDARALTAAIAALLPSQRTELLVHLPDARPHLPEHSTPTEIAAALVQWAANRGQREELVAEVRRLAPALLLDD